MRKQRRRRAAKVTVPLESGRTLQARPWQRDLSLGIPGAKLVSLAKFPWSGRANLLDGGSGM